MDTIALYQAGVTNVAASLGTALTENQARLIKRYTKNVVLSYDADGAGRAAALRGLDILKAEECKVRVLHVTDGKDPDEYIKKNGKDAFLKLVDGALPYGDYKLEAAKIGYDLSKDEDRIDYIKTATDIIRNLSPVEQEIYIEKTAKALKVSESAIRMEMMGHAPVEIPKVRQAREEETQHFSVDIQPLEKTLLKVLFTREDFIPKVKPWEQVFQTEFAGRVYQTLEAEYQQSQTIDIKRIMDSLPVEGAKKLSEILNQIVLGGNEEQVFEECRQTWLIHQLEEEERRLITLLSMADEEDNQERIQELTDQLMKIQRDRKNI